MTYDNPTRYEPEIEDESVKMQSHPHGDYVEHGDYDLLLEAYNEAVEKLEKINSIAS